MKVYIVRHGQTESNLQRTYNTEFDDLTELGVLQAEQLREKINEISFDAIFCSPLLRAKHTAEIVNSKNIPIIYDERLKERLHGNFSGKPLLDVNREEKWNYYSAMKQGTIEDIKVFFERVYSFLEDLKAKDYKTVLIVAHKGVSRAFDGYFEGIQDGNFFNRGLKNCEVKEYEL